MDWVEGAGDRGARGTPRDAFDSAQVSLAETGIRTRDTAAADRIARRLEALRELAPQRLAWTRECQLGREWLRQLAQERGLDFEADSAGNHWLTLPGTRGGALVIGGHIDTGADGHGDAGALGLLAGLELLDGFVAAHANRPTIRLVDWADGSGYRFDRPFGASAASGRLRDWFVAQELVDRSGVTLLEVAQAGGTEPRLAPMARRSLLGTRAYVELGAQPRHESAPTPEAVRVATHLRAVDRCRISWSRPAGVAGAPEGHLDRAGERFAAAAARLSAASGAIARARVEPLKRIAAGVVEQTVEHDADDEAALERLLGQALDASDRIAREAALTVSWQRRWRAPAARFDARLVGLAQDVLGDTPTLADGTCAASELARAGIPSLLLLQRSTQRPATSTEIAAGFVALTALVDAIVAQW